MRQALILFIFALLPLQVRATDIVIFEQKGDYSGFLQGLKEWKERIGAVFTNNTEGKKKLGSFEVAYIKGHRILGREELIRDVDKHDTEDDKWHEITLEASVAVPYLLPLSSLPGPVDIAVEANGKVSASKRYRIVMPDVLALASTDTLDLKGYIGKIYKMISIPLTAARLRDMLPAGAEIATEGERTLLLRVGPRVGTVGVALKASTHVLLSSVFKSSLKVMTRVKGHTFVNYRVETTKEFNLAAGAKLTTGLTFINTSFLDNVLGSELITAELARERQKSLVYDFIYDLSYPEAGKALGRALIGDLSPSQDIAVFRSGAADYQGIAIMEKSSDLLVEVVKSGQVAFTAGDKLLSPVLRELVEQELSGSFLDFRRNLEKSEAETTSINAIEEREEIASFKYSYDRTNNFLMGLVASNVSNINVDSTAMLANIVSESQGLQEATLSKLDFSYLYHEKKNSSQIVANFFHAAQKVLGANQKALGDVISSIQNSNHCSGKDAKFEISGVFYDRAVQNLSRYRPPEVWVGVAKIAGYEPASAFRYETMREKIIAKLKRKSQKLLKRFSEQAMPFWSNGFDRSDKKLVAEKMRDMFVNLKGDPFLLELLIFLASADYRQSKDPDRFSQGVTVEMSLWTPDCRFSWKQRGNLRYSAFY